MEVPKELKGAELQCVVGLKDVIIVFVNRWTVLSGRLSNIHILSPGEFHSIHRPVYLACRYPTRIKHCWVQPIVCKLLVPNYMSGYTCKGTPALSWISTSS